MGDVLTEEGVNYIDAMKIDVEGADDRVLKPFLEDAPQSLLPRCVVMEDLGQHLWNFDCIEGFKQRGLQEVARVGNNIILEMPN